jgi:isocitrate dehydrogenase
VEHFVDDDIKGGSAKQTIMKYYNTGFKVIAEKNQITDEQDKVLKEGKSLSNQFHNKYNVYKNLADYISTYQIQLPN